mgnify:CR=1 FL=1
MRKSVFVKGIAIALSISLFTGCGLVNKNSSSADEDSKKIVIGATPSPHAEILNKAKEVLSKQGYELEIVEYTDYVSPKIYMKNLNKKLAHRY